MISPFMSQAFGLVIGIITGGSLAVAIWMFLEYMLDFWYIGQVLGPFLAIIFGRLATYDIYTKRLRAVPLNWVGVSLFLGKPTGGIYQNGNHWVFPYYSILNVPGSNEKFILEMPGERINAQDGVTILFGIPEEGGGKKNRLQYSVVNPIAYIATDDPEDSLREAYLEKARLFFGQASKAIGVKNEKTLFSDFIALPQADEVDAEAKHAEFRARLENSKFMIRSEEPLFSPGSIEVIMSKAGDFAGKCESWGIGNIVAFTPNVRTNPAIEKAAEQKQVAVELMESLQTKADKIKELAEQLVASGVNPDLAMTLIAGLSGQKVDIANKTINLSGLTETLKMLVDTIKKEGKQLPS